MTKYQTGELTEAQVALVAEALKSKMDNEASGPNPDRQKVDELAGLLEAFDPAQMIPLDD